MAPHGIRGFGEVDPTRVTSDLVRGGDPAARFAFIEREQGNHSIALLCRLLGVSPSGFYAWRKRGQSARAQEDEALTVRIRAIHQQSGRTYGAPRMHAELRAAGIRCGLKRVARLMKAAGLAGRVGASGGMNQGDLSHDAAEREQ